MIYTESHEWVQVQEKTATVGVSAWAQKEVGEIVFIQLPKVGESLNNGDLCCVMESTKAAADIYTPLTGTILEVNTKLQENPGLINSHPETEGWIYKISVDEPSELEALMDKNTYYKLVHV